ncbi:MAG: L-threonine dehydratase catabolic TdcB [Alphaproteobacteria bacterium MarineAlpha2_Bin1]|nr:MAG: L-threonine dehydratase catabolic TdcB [Alphaproteobacteria bacterium MarineAlpha2_Bin1]
MVHEKIDIKDAFTRIEKEMYTTKLLETNEINQKFGIRIFVKPECKQRTGSFKYRGAYNYVSKLLHKSKMPDLVCFSSGNHGKAVAAVARKFNLNSTIFMPETAPKYKILNTKKYNSNVILHSGTRASMEKRAIEYAKKNNSNLIRPFDDKDIIAGQGTIGIEICREFKEKKLNLDAVLIPCSGGGLAAGIALAVKEVFPMAKIHPVEPENYDDTTRSLQASKILSNKNLTKSSICDALLVPKPGNITFKINQKLLSNGITVSDDDVIQAMQIGYKYFNLILEPGGAVGLAVLLKKKFNEKYKNIVIIASGGNISKEIHNSYMGQITRK